MLREFHFQIKSNDAGITVGDFLRKNNFSHSTIVHLKKTAEGIQKNNVWCYVNDRLECGDTLDVHLIENSGSEDIKPVAMDLDILYEDEDLLILNKPADMPVHPSYKNYENTLANGVMHYYLKQGISYTFRCITRLDRDTTGVTVLAKNMYAAGILSVMMQEHRIQKEYMAICEGQLPVSGVIDAPIARKKDSVIERCVDFEHGEIAITRFCCEQYANGLSLARVYPETGRTHQIRVHMKHIGCPLIGDFLYHPESKTLMHRQALHCSTVTFPHPESGRVMTFRAPLQEDMADVICHNMK